MTNPANNTVANDTKTVKNQTDNQARVERLEDGRFMVAGDLNFQTVPVISQQGQALFANCSAIDVDLSGVVRSNSAGLALLIEWMRFAKFNNQSIAFHHLPSQMQDIARVCGIDGKLPS